MNQESTTTALTKSLDEDGERLLGWRGGGRGLGKCFGFLFMHARREFKMGFPCCGESSGGSTLARCRVSSSAGVPEGLWLRELVVFRSSKSPVLK